MASDKKKRAKRLGTLRPHFGGSGGKPDPLPNLNESPAVLFLDCGERNEFLGGVYLSCVDNSLEICRLERVFENPLSFGFKLIDAYRTKNCIYFGHR